MCPAVLCLLSSVACPLRAAPDDAPAARWPARPDAEGQAFDGGRFVPLPPTPDAGKGPFAVWAWVKPTDLAGGDPTWGRGVARSTHGERVGDWLLSVHPDGRVRFIHWRQAGAVADGGHVTADALIEPDAWHLLVAAWDGTAVRLYVNGVEARHAPTETSSGWQTGDEVGRSWTQPGYHWVGVIGEVRVHRRAPTAAEVLADFRGDPRSKVQMVELKPAGDARVSAALDREIDAKLAERGLTPAPPADDAEFLRRVTLDLAGRIPIVAEVEAFLADAAPDKRTKLVENLLAGREMPLYWSQVLSGWLMPPEARRDPKFVGYLRAGLTANKPWDRFVREMLLARPTGPGDQHASAFLLSRKQALQDGTLARDVGRTLFGVNLRCAQCHDHPHVAAWTRERFVGLSAFFARSYEAAYVNEAKQPMVALGERATGELEYATARGKKVAPLMFLDGTVVAEPPPGPEPTVAKNAPPPTPAFSRREALARVALDRNSPYLKRAIVNRVWRQLMGRGLVEPADMMHEGNPASHPRLLDLLADDFADHGFDLRRLVAVITQSQAYARSGRWPGDKDLPDEALYAVALLRPLDADQLALSLPLATGFYDDQLGGPAKRTMAQARAVAAWPDVVAQFDAPGDEAEHTTVQALFLLNSEYVQKHFVADSKLVKALSALSDDAAVARRAYRAILSRSPTPEETARVARYLAERGGRSRVEACRELVWALFSGPEFRFNH